MTKLGDVVDMTFGNAFKSAEFSTDDTDIRLLRGDNVAQGRLRWDGAKRFPASRLSEVRRYQLRAGDVVIAMDRPWIAAGLKYAVVREADLPCLLVQRVARLRAKEGLDQGYLSAIIASKAFSDYVLAVQTGSAVPHISGGQIADFELFSLPRLEEQRAIAATLGALDDKIESNRRVVYQALELLDAMADADCSSVPTTSLGSLTGLTRETVSPATLGDAAVDHYSLPAFDASGRPERVPASTIMSNKIGLAGTSVLVSRLNPATNRTWWADPAGARSALASTEFAVLSASTEVELAAIWLAVRHPMFLEELPRRVTGTSGSHQRVRPDDMLAIDVPDVRLLDDGTKQAALSLLRLAHQRREESAKLSKLRDTLLPELLSGRIRVPEAAAVVEDGPG